MLLECCPVSMGTNVVYIVDIAPGMLDQKTETERSPECARAKDSLRDQLAETFVALVFIPGKPFQRMETPRQLSRMTVRYSTPTPATCHRGAVSKSEQPCWSTSVNSKSFLHRARPD